MRQFFFVFSILCLFMTGALALNASPAGLLEEYGKAGYYSDKLQGRKTASGEPYDKDALTCAHKTLPFGTLVRITRLDNNASVVVKVNDRGPYHDGFVVDISRKAAEAIGLIKDGTTRVKVEVVEQEIKTAVPPAQSAVAKPAQYSTPSTAVPVASKIVSTGDPSKNTTTKSAPNAKLLLPKSTTGPTVDQRPATYSTNDPRPAAVKAQPVAAAGPKTRKSELYKVDLKKTEKRGFGVQISTLYDADNVLPIVTKLEQQWAGKVLVSLEDGNGDQSTYRVAIGPFADRKSAEAQQKIAVKKGYAKCFVVSLNEL